MAGWHHKLYGHESEQAQGDSEAQGSLACCSSWGGKESDTTLHLNNKNNQWDTSGIYGGLVRILTTPDYCKGFLGFFSFLRM